MEENDQGSAVNSPEGENFKTPKSLLFSILSILWIFPSITAIWLIARDFSALRDAHGLGEFLSAIKLEQWTGVILLLVHMVFIFLALHWRQRGRRKI